ncbi:MAG: hypothetical protein FJ098_04280, partial [Deltaproteobacteria bacterium]|nr:hypothetical protein [Deltaproteobacteria bacterium]
QPGGSGEDVTTSADVPGGADIVLPPADTAGGPKTCEQLWQCTLDRSCALAPLVEDSDCLQKCVEGQSDEHVERYLALKECAAGSCSTAPTGEELTACAYQFCTDRWLACVASGEGEKTCGDMHNCLRKSCAPDFSSPSCISACLRDGDQKADQLLASLAVCSNTVYFVSAPLECTGGMAECYAGSGNGVKGCGKALTCELECYAQHCPDPDLCTDFGGLSGCLLDCLFGLSASHKERMIPLQQCMLKASHDELVEEGVNIYGHCAGNAHECFGEQDQFLECQDAMSCLRNRYDHFPSVLPVKAETFWIIARDCLQDIKHSDRDELSAALACLQAKYSQSDTVWNPLEDPWFECPKLCDD